MAGIGNAISSMLSLVIVTVFGYVAARAGHLSAEVRPKLSGLIFNITLPCSILASVGTVDTSLDGTTVAWSFVLAALIFFVMLLGALAASFAVRAPRAERPLYLFMGILTNTGFVGFAVLSSIFGGASVFLGSIFIAVSNVFIYSIGVGLLTAGAGDGATGGGAVADGPAERAVDGGSAGGALADGMTGDAALDGAAFDEMGASRKAVPSRRERMRTLMGNMVNPPLVASLIAMVLFFSGAVLPSFLAQGIASVGNVTSPLAMMLVGLSIADADLGAVLRDMRLWGFAFVRFLVFPLAAYFVFAPFVPSALALEVFVVMLAMPTGSMAGPIAATYGQDGGLPSRGTIVSTLASFAIVPVLMIVMGA